MKPGTLFLLAGLLSAALAAGYPANQAKDDRTEVALQAAIKKEAVDGDLKGAIELYKKIAQSGNRAVAAKALVRMGQCYEKLGDAEAREARKAYERVVREFADQKEAAEQARARLAAKGRDARSGTGVVARQVSADVDVYPSGLSPDGRYLSFEDGETGDVAIRDFTTGEKRRLTNKGSWAESWQETGSSAFSPDGKQVAYGWWVPKPKTGELRLIGLDGSAPRVVYRSAEMDWVDAYAWSPDGKQVLAVVWSQSNTNPQIVWISVADGSARLVKTMRTSLWPDNLTLSPDGRYIAYDYAPKEGSAEIFLLTADGSREIALAQDPANDRSPVWTPDGKSIVFLSDRTGSTAAWRIEVAEGKPGRSPELVKQDMGRSALVGFTPKGSLYYSVKTGTEDVYSAGLDLASGKVMVASERVVQRFVGSNSKARWSPDGQYLAYLRRGASQPFWLMSSTIHIRSVKTGEEREIPLKLSRWYGDYSWSPDGRSFLVAAFGQNGRQGIYRAEVETGEATPVVLAKPGEFLQFPRASRDGKLVFLRKATATGGEWYAAIVVRDLEGRESELARGLVETIAVSPDGGGVAATIAEAGRGTVLKVLPTDGGGSREVFRIEKEKGATAGSIEWSADGRFVLFGWQPKTGVPENELWVIPAEGGKPQKLDLPTKQMLLSPHAHPDGRRIAFTAGTPFRTEIWAMDNLLPAPKASR